LSELGRTLPLVSIIIPCYNEETTITSLLNAIAVQSFPLEKLEVIIADGISSDSTRTQISDFLKAQPEINIRIIDNLRRIIPAALNLAIAVSAGDYIIRLDAHSIPAPDYVDRCVEILATMDAANVGGIWEIQPGEGGWMASGIAAAAAHSLGAGGARYRVGGPAGPVDTVPFGAFRREWLDRVGPFDETLLTNEDYEYNVRIRAAGGTVYFDPRIRSVYLARPDLVSLARQYARYGYWKAQMLSRYPRTVRLRQLIPPIFVLSLLLLFLFSPFSWLMRTVLAVELGVYLFVTLGSALVEAWRRKDFRLIVSFPLAIVTMQLSWGGGFLVSIGKLLMGRKNG
jgi:glycosyltransferase involved in cell wall biosynthesis